MRCECVGGGPRRLTAPRAAAAGVLAALVALGGCSRSTSPEPEKKSETKGTASRPTRAAPADELTAADRIALRRLEAFKTGALPPEQQYRTIKAYARREDLAPSVRQAAREYLKKLEGRLREQVEKAFADVEARAGELRKAGQLGEALAEYGGFERKYPLESRLLVDRIASRKGEINKAIAERLQADEEKIKAATEAGRFDDALAIARGILTYGHEAACKRADRLETDILEARQERQLEEEQKRMEAERRRYEAELAAEAAKKKAEAAGKAGGEEAPGAGGEKPEVAGGEETASTGGEEPATPGGGETEVPEPGEQAAPEPAGEPFAALVTLASRDRKTGRLTIRPVERRKGPRRTYYLEIPEGAVCHADVPVTVAQIRKIEKDTPVCMYGSLYERSDTGPGGGSYGSIRLLQNLEAVAFGPAITPDKEYKSPRLKGAKWLTGRLAEFERVPEIIIEGKGFELRGGPRTGCLFRRIAIETSVLRRGTAFVVGQARELPAERASKTPDILVRARACLIVNPRLVRLPVYRALYEKYDPSKGGASGQGKR